MTALEIDAVTVATYGYTGQSGLVNVDYPEIDVFSHRFDASGGTYPALDRFNRVTLSEWTKDLPTDRNIYETSITYDENSNIELVEDNIHAGFDVDSPPPGFRGGSGFR